MKIIVSKKLLRKLYETGFENAERTDFDDTIAELLKVGLSRKNIGVFEGPSRDLIFEISDKAIELFLSAGLTLLDSLRDDAKSIEDFLSECA